MKYLITLLFLSSYICPANLPVGSMYPLHQAARDGNKDACLKLLTDHHININTQDYLGNTALHYAVEYEQIEVVRLFLTYRGVININTRNNMNQTPLMVSDICGRTAIGRLIILFAFNSSTNLSPLVAQREESARNQARMNAIAVERGAVPLRDHVIDPAPLRLLANNHEQLCSLKKKVFLGCYALSCVMTVLIIASYSFGK